MINNKIFILFLLHVAFSYAQPNKFPVAARIKTSEVPAYSKINLSQEFYSFSKNALADLRIYSVNGNDTIEQSYYLNAGGDKNQQTATYAKISNLSKNGNQVSFDLDFGSVKTFRKLFFELEKQSEFDCRVSVLIPSTNGFDTAFVNERISGIYHRNNFYSFLTIQFPELVQQKIKVVLKSIHDFNFPSISNVMIDEFYVPETKGVKAEGSSLVSNQEKEKTSTIIWECKKANFISGFGVQCKQNADFVRNAELFYENDRGGKSIFTSLGTYTLSSFRDSLYINLSDYHDFGIYTKKLKLVIQNEDNTPLENIQCKAFHPVIEIYSSLKPNTEYWLMTGYQECPLPNYDLLNFKEKILNETKNQVAMTHENVIANPFFKGVVKEEAMIKSKVWMWLALLVGAILMIVFSLSMLKKLKKE